MSHPNNASSKARKLRYHHKVQEILRPKAVNYWQPWTIQEMELALDRSLTAREIAAKIGRTAKGVEKIRRNQQARITQK